MTAALQRKLVLDDPTLCPLLDIAGARAALPGHDEDDILALVEERYLEAFDLSYNLVVARRECRVLKASVEHFQQTGGSRPARWSVEKILAEVLKGWAKPWMEATRVKLLLNCSSTHIYSLLENRDLRVMPGTTWDRGPGNSAQIEMESLKRFLKGARL